MTSADKKAGSDGDNVRIFSVITRFQKLALRPGGIPRDKAIAAANVALETLQPELDSWIDDEIAALRNTLPDGGEDQSGPDWVAAAEVHAGRLRDVGTTAGYALITFVATAMCDILESGEAATAHGIDSLNCHFDALKLLRAPQYHRLRPEDLPELKQGLLRLVARVGSRATESEPTGR